MTWPKVNPGGRTIRTACHGGGCDVDGALDLEGNARDILALGDRLCNAGGLTPKTGSESWKWWRHTRTRDRKNIQYHHDVSNDFYAHCAHTLSLLYAQRAMGLTRVFRYLLQTSRR